MPSGMRRIAKSALNIVGGTVKNTRRLNMKKFILECIEDFALFWTGGFAGGFFLGVVIFLACYVAVG